MSAKAPGGHTNGFSSARNSPNRSVITGRTYTLEQKAAVIRVRRCKPTAFYDILGLDGSCADGKIRKAYRQLSLLTHPDKNGYEGADEAFKMVSRAFHVLSDTDKKSQYDKSDHNPDDRPTRQSAASGASLYSECAQSPGAWRRAPVFEDESIPEELFRQFFGGSGNFVGGSMRYSGKGSKGMLTLALDEQSYLLMQSTCFGINLDRFGGSYMQYSSARASPFAPATPGQMWRQPPPSASKRTVELEPEQSLIDFLRSLIPILIFSLLFFVAIIALDALF